MRQPEDLYYMVHYIYHYTYLMLSKPTRRPELEDLVEEDSSGLHWF